MTTDTNAMIGRRLREVRAWRGLTLDAVAGLAGFSKAYLSMIERGQRPVQRRSTVEALAAALQVAPSELTGQPLIPANPAESENRGGVNDLHAALLDIETGLTDTSAELMPMTQLRDGVARSIALSAACDYAALAAIVPGLIRQAHMHAESGEREARELFVRVLVPAFYLAKDPGHHHVAWTVARHLHAAATEVGSPEWVALADFLRAEAMTGTGARARARQLVERAADALSPDSGPQGEMWGMLRLSAALQAAVVGDPDAVPALLGEATEMAERTTGGNFADLHFGAPNVAVWSVALAVELGDLDRVPHLAQQVQVDAISSAGRKASFWMDYGRGLAGQRGKAEQAVRALRTAEDLAPQLVHANPYVRDAVTDLLVRARADAGGRDLRGLAYRLDIAG